MLPQEEYLQAIARNTAETVRLMRSVREACYAILIALAAISAELWYGFGFKGLLLGD